ncbi:MAG TPA: phosphatase PAP2 family protein [Thermomicrobiales bacterium]
MFSRTGTVPAQTAPLGFRRALLAPLFSALLLVSLLFGVVFVLLAEEVHESATLPTDQRVLRAVDSRTASWPVAIGNDVGLVASEVGIVVLGVLLVGWHSLRQRWLDALLFLGAVGGYGVLTLLVKHLVQRQRPIAFFRIPESGYSFPSGHTLGATCLAFALGFVLWRGGVSRGQKVLGSVALLLGVLVVAMSRLMLGVHYPTDVLGSVLLGTAWMSALIALRCATEWWLVARGKETGGR